MSKGRRKFCPECYEKYDKVSRMKSTANFRKNNKEYCKQQQHGYYLRRKNLLGQNVNSNYR